MEAVMGMVVMEVMEVTMVGVMTEVVEVTMVGMMAEIMGVALAAAVTVIQVTMVEEEVMVMEMPARAFLLKIALARHGLQRRPLAAAAQPQQLRYQATARSGKLTVTTLVTPPLSLKPTG